MEIGLPPLRERSEDIHLLFRKFATDFAQKYKMPTIRLDEHATQLLLKYRWGGNIRQLRNIAEQISVLEQDRVISYDTLKSYLPDVGSNLPAVINTKKSESDFASEREILYKVLFDMQRDVNDLKKLTLELLRNDDSETVQREHSGLINKIYSEDEPEESFAEAVPARRELIVPSDVEVIGYNDTPAVTNVEDKYHFAEEIQEEETLSLQEKELELIKKSLEKYNGKRKAAAEELGISERTLYRKIKQYNL